MFTLYPAIDLRGGRCVRLIQGDYGRETIYGSDPVEMAKRWRDEGAEWLHVVDLDAARSGEPVNMPSIEAIVKAVDIPVQVGGGIRDRKRVEALLELGVSRLILGSAAVENPEFVHWAVDAWGEKIAVSIDSRDGYVATRGWLETTEVQASELARRLAKIGVQTFIFTDISRDGMLSGPNVEAVRQLAAACGKPVIASGGVGRSEDVVALSRHVVDGVTGVIIGRALYTGDIQLAELLSQLKQRDK